jgi:hypothetical protein
MDRSRLAAWLGVMAVMGVGFGVLWWAYQPARSVVERDSPERVEPHRAQQDRSGLPGETERAEPFAQRDGRGHVIHVSVVRTAPAVVASPPLPSRVLPGPLPASKAGGPADAALSPSPRAPRRYPPVPDKTLPGPDPREGDESSDEPSESDSSVEN